MQVWQRTRQLIADQLGARPGTAKLLIGALMVILVMSLLLVAQLTGRPSMVPLPIDLGPEARIAALRHLEAAGISHEERGGQVMVPASQRHTVLAQLTDHAVISGDQINFDSLIDQDSPFLTRDQHDKRWLTAKMNVLSSLVGKFRGIERATVMIDDPKRRGFGSSHVAPTASVTLFTRAGQLSQSQVEAIAHLVAGSHAALKAEDVRVIDARTGRAHQARRDDDLASAKYLEMKREAEKHIKATLADALAYIPGVRIAVNAMVDARRIESRIDNFQDPKVGPLKSTRRTIDSSDRAAGGVPGVQANTGAAVSLSGGGGSTMTDERSEEATQSVFPRDARHVTDPKGYALKINATILVPRSYFLSKYRQDQNDSEAVPDDTALQATVTGETQRIRTDVEPLIDTAAFEDAIPGTVVVSMIPDFGTIAGLVPPHAGSSEESLGGGAVGGGLVKYAGLGGLALLSLTMMFLMVRKAGDRHSLPSAEELAGIPQPLESDEGVVVGEAEESAMVLEGVELTDEALRRQQMLDQINDLVKQHPGEAANLLGRWIRVETS